MSSLWCLQVKEKEGELKAAEQRLHDEFERLRKQHNDEKKTLEDKRRELVSLPLKSRSNMQVLNPLPFLPSPPPTLLSPPSLPPLSFSHLSSPHRRKRSTSSTRRRRPSRHSGHRLSSCTRPNNRRSDSQHV